MAAGAPVVGGDDRSDGGEAPAKRRRTKRIKTLNLTAEGKWEEEEESIECSSEEDVGDQFVSNKKPVEDAIPEASFMGVSVSPLNFDESSSEEEYIPWAWMKTASAKEDDEDERGTDDVKEVYDPIGEAIAASVAEIMQGTEKRVATNLSRAEPLPEEPSVDEEICAEPQFVPESKSTAPDYVPGSFVTLLLKPHDKGEQSAEESDVDDADDPVDDDPVDDDIVDNDPVHDEDVETSPKPNPTLCRDINHERSTAGRRGCLQKRGRVPRMRGSIRLCMPVEECAEDELDEIPEYPAPPAVSSRSMPEDSESASVWATHSSKGVADQIPEDLLSLNSLALGRIFMNRPAAEVSPEEEVAMQVLARHVARLGVGGPGLEQAVFLAAQRGLRNDASSWRRWEFLARPDGLQAYIQERGRFSQIYTRHIDNLHRCDSELRRWLPSVESTSQARAATPNSAVLLGGPMAGMVNLEISNIRFAHHAQREHFGHLHLDRNSTARRGVLQLAVEFLMGLTQPADVPTFRVCLHNDEWYCYTGNRRLASFRLAHSFAPNRFARLAVPIAQADDSFLRGTEKLMPKFTTFRNGDDCQGQWLFIRETGEPVGLNVQGCNEYGHDLLSLMPMSDIPVPVPRPQTRNGVVDEIKSGRVTVPALRSPPLGMPGPPSSPPPAGERRSFLDAMAQASLKVEPKALPVSVQKAITVPPSLGLPIEGRGHTSLAVEPKAVPVPAQKAITLPPSLGLPTERQTNFKHPAIIRLPVSSTACQGRVIKPPILGSDSERRQGPPTLSRPVAQAAVVRPPVVASERKRKPVPPVGPPPEHMLFKRADAASVTAVV